MTEIAARITKVEKREDGTWTARVTPGATGRAHVFTFGRGDLWTETVDGVRREALPWLAERLNAKLPADALLRRKR